MKSNFTKAEFNKIFSIFNGKWFKVHLNKAGNIYLDVLDPMYFNKFSNTEGYYGYDWRRRIYGFYRSTDGVGYVIRSLNYFTNSHYGCNSIFPLNMNYKSRHVPYSLMCGDGKLYTGTGYNIKYSSFPTLDEAIDYFIKYLKYYYMIDIKKPATNTGNLMEIRSRIIKLSGLDEPEMVIEENWPKSEVKKQKNIFHLVTKDCNVFHLIRADHSLNGDEVNEIMEKKFNLKKEHQVFWVLMAWNNEDIIEG